MKQVHTIYRYCLLFSLLLTAQFLLKAQIVLSGKIIDSNNHSNIAGASVYIPDIKAGAASRSDGTFEIKNIPNGTYLVEASMVGYASQIKEIIINGHTVIGFELQKSALESPEVIVTGVFSATEQQTNPAPVSTISQNTLLRTTGNNIIDALRNSPGMSQISDGPAISKPVIRGLGYNRVVVVNDGIRQEGQQFGDEFGIEIDPFTVHKVEILRGPASLSYGSDAMAGVINMLSAPVLPDGQVKGNIQGVFQTNNGQYGGSVNIAGHKNGLTYDARYTHFDAHAFRNKYDGYVFNSGYGENNLKGSIGLSRHWGYSRIILSSFDLKTGIVEGGRDEVTGRFTRHIMGSDGSDSVVIVSDVELKSYAHDQIIHQHVRHYKAVWDNGFALGNGRLGVRLGFQQNHRQEANDATLGNTYNIYFFLNTFNYDVHYIVAEKDHFELTFGTNGMQQASQNKGVLFLVPEYHLFDLGIFAVAKKTFNKLSVTGGLRFDNRSLHGDGLSIDSSGLKVQPDAADAVHRFTAYRSDFSGISGSIGATYHLTKSLYGKINLSRAFRAPNIAESGSNGIHDGTPFYEIGDPSLKPEHSLQIDATLGLVASDVSAELTLFDNNIDNYIFPVKLASVSGGDSIRNDVMAASDGPAFKYVSGNAILTGAELTFNIHPHNTAWFHFDNTFSFIRSVQKNQPDSTKNLPYTPPAKIFSVVEVASKKTARPFRNLYLRLEMEQYFKQDKIYYKFGNETITPAYTLLNIGMGTDIVSKGYTLFSIYMYARNIADVAYQSNMSRLKYGDTNNATGRTGVYEMGRNIGVRLNIPFNFKR